MIVCIAEKPSVAKDIARILKADHPCQGYMEGNGYQVTWTFGHLCELKAPEDYTPQWKAWRMATLPMIPQRFGIRLKNDEGIKKQFAVIEKLMQAADEIINCGDAGQEGELIQRWVMQKAKATCPVKRLWISSMTDEAIRQGFAELKAQQDYDRLYLAGLCRAIGDWLLGMNCTRLYTLRYLAPGQKGCLSVGRVQTPTLALVVKRQEEIDHFKPEPFWVLSTLYRQTTFTAAKGKFATEQEGQEALEKVIGKPFTIKEIKEKKGVEHPPRLYDLTTLQVDCNRQFGFSAQQTLQLIQSLYEKKLTTYPRVDTTFLPDDVYPKCPGILKGLKGYEQFTQSLLSQPLPKTKKVFDTKKVTDHHAIIPTGQAPQALSEQERKVYDLITRTFIAAFYPDCQFRTTSVTGIVEDVEFKASGKRITSPGWRLIFPPRQAASTAATQEGTPANEGEGESLLPPFEKGESGPHQPSLARKETQPPSYYTEASLLRAMETAGKLVDDEALREALKDNGIGRPSTRAAIIETLYKRDYIRKERRHLVATPTGQRLINLIHEELLKSAELTGQWEKKLREIERGQYEPNTFLEELKSMLQQIITQVMTAPIDISKPAEPQQMADPTGQPCPLCHQGTIIKGHTAYGCSRWKEGCNYRLPLQPKQPDNQ